MEYFIFLEKKIVDNLGAWSESFLIIEKHRQGNPTLETPGSQRGKAVCIVQTIVYSAITSSG